MISIAVPDTELLKALSRYFLETNVPKTAS
jgi:hypothetical protein